MITDFAKLCYDTLLTDATLTWTSDELTVFASIIARDRYLSEGERAALLEHVDRKREHLYTPGVRRPAERG